jgi:hypothetical protein
VDLLIALELGADTHLIVLEAKGETRWTNSQLSHKADRFRAIFGDEGTAWERVVPHFVIASPRPSKGLTSSKWPSWMTPEDGRPLWLQLPMPDELHQVTRCDPSGRPSITGTHWAAIPSRLQRQGRL